VRRTSIHHHGLLEISEQPTLNHGRYRRKSRRATEYATNSNRRVLFSIRDTISAVSDLSPPAAFNCHDLRFVGTGLKSEGVNGRNQTALLEDWT
jgi:hypothetical protein